MDISALTGGAKYDHEGYMMKSASSKGKDQLRKGLLGKSTFKERYFAMKDKTLTYYKQKGDQKYLDLIDLEFATIDNGDHVTGKPFTLRIAQAKMVYTYLMCDSIKSYKSWLPALRWAAGYSEESLHDDKIKEKKVIASGTFSFYAPLVCLLVRLPFTHRGVLTFFIVQDRADAMCTFGVLWRPRGKPEPEKLVIIFRKHLTLLPSKVSSCTFYLTIQSLEACSTLPSEDHASHSAIAGKWSKLTSQRRLSSSNTFALLIRFSIRQSVFSCSVALRLVDTTGTHTVFGVEIKFEKESDALTLYLASETERNLFILYVKDGKAVYLVSPKFLVEELWSPILLLNASYFA